MYLQSHIYKNIPVSFDFITTWNQGVFLCSSCIIFTKNQNQLVAQYSFLFVVDLQHVLARFIGHLQGVICINIST